jgi:putative aldouronate transport system permease protein
MCLIPFLITLSGSFTDETALKQGISLIPQKFSIEAYKMILSDPGAMINAYLVTIALVIVGTSIALFITSMTAFVLYRKDFKYRSQFAFFFFFTTLFSGGLIPHYLLITTLGLRNSFAVLVLSGVFSVFNMIIVRTYFTTSVPDSICESAKIDGANDFIIFVRLYLPLAKPVLATVGLFTAVSYWNEWYNAMLYISNNRLFPLQYFLYKILNSMSFAQSLAQNTGGVQRRMPQESYKLAMTIFTLGPVVAFYPFVQKYFVKGMTIGSVKG